MEISSINLLERKLYYKSLHILCSVNLSYFFILKHSHTAMNFLYRIIFIFYLLISSNKTIYKELHKHIKMIKILFLDKNFKKVLKLNTRIPLFS